MKKYILFFGILMLIAACSRGNKNSVEIDGVSFDSVAVDTTVLLTNQRNSPKASLSLHIQYAKGKNEKVINQELLQSGILLPAYFSEVKNIQSIGQAAESFARQFASDYKKEYGNLYKQDKEFGDSYNMELHLTTTTHSFAGHTISYIAKIYSYNGGAHGFSQTLVKNFDSKTGRLLTLGSLFVEDSQASLLDLIIEELCKKFDVKDKNELKEKYISDIDDLYVPDNFIVYDKKITFIYCEDEIASHAVGEIRVDINKGELKKYLK